MQAQRLGDLPADAHHRVERRPADPGRPWRCGRRAARRTRGRTGRAARHRRSARCPLIVAASGASPTIDSAVSVLPEPDSPIMPRRPPSATANDTPSTTRRPPISTTRSVDLEQRVGRSARRLRRSPRAERHDGRRTHGGSTGSPRRAPRSRGSMASRRPSPRRLNPSVASTTARPGNTSAPGWTVIDCCKRLQHPPPRRRRHRGQPEVAERGLGEHGEGGDQRELDDHRRGDVGDDVPPHRAPRRRARRAWPSRCSRGSGRGRPRPARPGPARRRRPARWPATPSTPSRRGRRRTPGPGSASAGR